MWHYVKWSVDVYSAKWHGMGYFSLKGRPFKHAKGDTSNFGHEYTMSEWMLDGMVQIKE